MFLRRERQFRLATQNWLALLLFSGEGTERPSPVGIPHPLFIPISRRLESVPGSSWRRLTLTLENYACGLERLSQSSEIASAHPPAFLERTNRRRADGCPRSEFILRPV
ncbi:hypothetical protein B5K06_24725 [Rhizobium grahamii]|uniref:Uncharacterized protein n=2 Tax=Rhizobium grahamii TaxID=1120045 RepID=S3HN83_9HYPH|nr:hypothetical protein RGCCGE502_30278 [Rhizobium grahamii CCGE 502]RDJ05657.1 hypothetical protein B5K06_24725 [Rhizobium grahamii]